MHRLGMDNLCKWPWYRWPSYRWFTMVYLLKMGGSFHGYVSHNQMVRRLVLSLHFCIPFVMIWCTLHLRGHDGGPFGSSSWEKKLFVINELDDDLRCTLSMEEGSELEDSEVHHEAGLMDLVAVSLDQFSL